MRKPIILICSVSLELEPLLPFLADREEFALAALRGWRGTIGGQAIVAVAGGMGKTNAAHALTLALEENEGEAVVGFGVGGAYPGSGLDVRDTAVASVEIYGDEGALTPTGWISCEGIGIPLAEGPKGRHFNEFPSDAALLETSLAAVEAGEVAARVGPFVTVSSCSGTAARGAELAARFGAVCESMEGAAYAHVAALYGVPFIEIRGISNLVEDRDPTRWDLTGAASTAARAVSVILGKLGGASATTATREGEAS